MNFSWFIYPHKSPGVIHTKKTTTFLLKTPYNQGRYYRLTFYPLFPLILLTLVLNIYEINNP